MVVTVALVIAMVGLVGASVAGVALASENAARARQSFERSSADVASTLQLTIREEESLIISASAFVLASPNASDAEFVKWLGTVHGFDRHPEVGGMLFIVFVQSSDLAPFMASVAANSAAEFGPKGPDEIVPPGERPFYCFAALGTQSVVSAVPLARGIDLCADPTGGSALISARDSGKGSYEPVVGGQGTVQLGLQTPVYRNGVVPPTVEARRAAFVGWTGVTLNQTSVLERALQNHPGMTASIHYFLNSSDVAFASGPVPAGAQSTSIDLHNGWTVQTFSVIDHGGVFDNWSATMLLLSIAAMSFVIAVLVLVLVLGTGRLRPLRLVAQRTGQLRHQALHDALTDLPNRALIMDRIDQLLARNRREGTPEAALFVDLDDFKNVNDTLGHLAGDGLLIAVAARLTTTLRDADTIGRLGGDEFVVLIDGGPQHAAPALVAQHCST